jgi:hypothetical protein
LDSSTRIGTLEPGKVTDIVLIDGNPLTNLNDLLQLVVTIQRWADCLGLAPIDSLSSFSRTVTVVVSDCRSVRLQPDRGFSQIGNPLE